MPVGHRDRSFFSRPAQMAALTLVSCAMNSRLMPRCIRRRRRFGPKAPRALMAEGDPQESFHPALAQKARSPAKTPGPRPVFLHQITFSHSVPDVQRAEHV